MTVIDTMTNLRMRVEQIKADWRTVHHYEHEDGTHSFIVIDEAGEHANPRGDDGNVTTLVMEHRDYRPLDDPDSELAAARERWDWLEHNHHRGYSNRTHFEVSSYHNAGEAALIRGHYDREKIMRRYLAMFHPDVLHYEDRWEVRGHSQGDWAYGWGYITRSDWEKWMGADYAGELTPKEAFEQEVHVYEEYFAGNVYGCVWLKQGEPIVTLGEHGAYVDDYEVDEESVWGHLAYDDPKDIVRQYVESPITDEH